MTSKLKPWKTVSSKILESCNWCTLLKEKLLTASGAQIDDYYILEETDGVLILPVLSKDEIIILRQYKHGAKEILLQFPAGRIDEQESRDTAAARELLEETGYLTNRLEYQGYLSLSPARIRSKLHIYFAYELSLSKTEYKRDELEDIEVEILSVTKLQELISKNQINCAASIASFAMYLMAKK